MEKWTWKSISSISAIWARALLTRLALQAQNRKHQGDRDAQGSERVNTTSRIGEARFVGVVLAVGGVGAVENAPDEARRPSALQR